MSAKSIIIWCLIGLVAGWLASVLVGGGGGLIRNMITGLLGAFVGGFLIQATGLRVNIGHPMVNEIVVAAIGAVVVVLLARLIA